VDKAEEKLLSKYDEQPVVRRLGKRAVKEDRKLRAFF